MEKEFIYVGHYTDTDGNFMLKVGTTNDLARRATEHTRNYRRAKVHTMPSEARFEYDFTLPLSKYNTLRIEDKTREQWKREAVGEFVRNDRFNCGRCRPASVTLTVRKTYTINFNPS